MAYVLAGLSNDSAWNIPDKDWIEWKQAALRNKQRNENFKEAQQELRDDFKRARLIREIDTEQAKLAVLENKMQLQKVVLASLEDLTLEAEKKAQEAQYRLTLYVDIKALNKKMRLHEELGKVQRRMISLCEGGDEWLVQFDIECKAERQKQEEERLAREKVAREKREVEKED